MSTRADASPPPSNRAAPPQVQSLASDQHHLAPLRKRARAAVRIVDGNAGSQCAATVYIGHGARAIAAHKLLEAHRPPARPTQHAKAPASIVLNTSEAASQHVFCYAVPSRADSVQDNFGLLRTATPHSLAALAPRATSLDCEVTRMQQFKERLAERTRMCTQASRALEQFPGSACKESLSALNCVQPERNSLYKPRSPQPRDDILSTSARALTPTVLPLWQHLHRAMIAQGYELDKRTRCDMRSCPQLELAPLYIKCSPQHSPSSFQNPAN